MQHNNKKVRDVRSLRYLQQVGTGFAVMLTFMPSHQQDIYAPATSVIQQDIYVPATSVIYKTIIPQTEPMCLQCQVIY